jgi:hypothetical protein
VAAIKVVVTISQPQHRYRYLPPLTGYAACRTKIRCVALHRRTPPGSSSTVGVTVLGAGVSPQPLSVPCPLPLTRYQAGLLHSAAACAVGPP